MGKQFDFTELENLDWHDSTLHRVLIDRTKPGYQDRIELLLSFSAMSNVSIQFIDVYFADLALNMGVIVEEETIFSFCILGKANDEVDKVISKWSKHYPEVVDVVGVEIITNSTNSRIVIVSKGFEIFQNYNAIL